MARQMERSRTTQGNLVEIVDVFVNYNSKSIKIMGPVREEKELFGCKVYVLDDLPADTLLMIDSRGKGSLVKVKVEEPVRLIRED